MTDGMLTGAVALLQLSAWAPQNSYEQIHESGKQLRVDGRFREAEMTFRSAPDIASSMAPESEEVANSLGQLASLYNQLRRYDEAEQLLGSNHPRVGRLLANHAVVLRKLRRGAEAKKLELRSRTIQAQNRMLGFTVDVRELASASPVDRRIDPESERLTGYPEPITAAVSQDTVAPRGSFGNQCFRRHARPQLANAARTGHSSLVADIEDLQRNR